MVSVNFFQLLSWVSFYPFDVTVVVRHYVISVFQKFDPCTPMRHRRHCDKITFATECVLFHWPVVVDRHWNFTWVLYKAASRGRNGALCHNSQVKLLLLEVINPVHTIPWIFRHLAEYFSQCMGHHFVLWDTFWDTILSPACTHSRCIIKLQCWDHYLCSLQSIRLSFSLTSWYVPPVILVRELTFAAWYHFCNPSVVHVCTRQQIQLQLFDISNALQNIHDPLTKIKNCSLCVAFDKDPIASIMLMSFPLNIFIKYVSSFMTCSVVLLSTSMSHFWDVKSLLLWTTGLTFARADIPTSFLSFL